jgi:DNA-binding transcriptional MerR regulator/methylmalonyl-CoA mutase cobalamin-binding subunit
MATATDATLPIRTIASLTGVNPITLRAWERRYGLIRPSRTAKGHRLYSQRDADQIRRVVSLVEGGVPISQVRQLLDAEVKPSKAITRGPWRAYLDRMLAAVSRFDELTLDRIYDEALSLHSIESITQHLILPLLAEIGQKWQKLAGAVAEEHFFCTFLRNKLGARLLHRMRYAEGPRVLAACAPGEQHEIGLLLFALKANEVGLRVVLLGADLPFDEVALAQRRSMSDAVVISSSIDLAPGQLKRDLAQLVRKTGVPVFVGGATAQRKRRDIVAAGAIALGVEIEHGVRLVTRALAVSKAVS